MINPKVIIKLPLNFKDKFNIYPPTVKEVLEDDNFGFYLKIFTTSEEDLKDELSKKSNANMADLPTPFEFLLINCYYHPEIAELTKNAFEFFVHKKINFFYDNKMIVVGDLEEEIQKITSFDELITIKEEDFFEFQNAIREVLGDPPITPYVAPNPNEDPRIAEIKRRARERDRIKARHNSKNGISLTTSLLAICCMGIGITPLNIGEMSYASIGPLMTMMQNKEKYDIDVRSLLAGADSKKVKPKYWIRNSEKE